MCTAPKTPSAPAPLAPPQAAKSPISVPTRRKQNGVPGTAGFVGTGSFADQSLLGTAPTAFNPIKKRDQNDRDKRALGYLMPLVALT